MKESVQTKLASFLMVSLSIWLLAAPSFIHIKGAGLANQLAVGLTVAAAGFLQLYWVNAIPSWVNGFTAIWLFIAAYLFDASTTAVWNMTLAAAIIFILAAWDGVEIDKLQRHHRAGV